MILKVFTWNPAFPFSLLILIHHDQKGWHKLETQCSERRMVFNPMQDTYIVFSVTQKSSTPDLKFSPYFLLNIM